MKIAHILPHWSPYDSRKPIGIKFMATTLMREQLKQGDDILIIAPTGSYADFGTLVTTIPSLKEQHLTLYDQENSAQGKIHAAKALQLAIENNVDIIHSHIEHTFLPFISASPLPVLSTIHGTNFTESENDQFQKYYNTFYAVAISGHAKEVNTQIKYNTMIYNGIDTSMSDYQYDTDDYLFWLGRFHPTKGPIEAMEIATNLKKQLKMIGSVQDKDYFEKVTSQANNQITINTDYLADVQKSQFIGKAKAFLFPLQWEEPFGLVIVESLAYGTPVIAFAKGSIPEIIKDGETGFIVNSSDQDVRGDFIIKQTGIPGMIEAVEKLYSLPEAEYKKMRNNSRQDIVKRFNSKIMAKKYNENYKYILS